VVDRILQANDLGHVRTPHPAGVVQQAVGSFWEPEDEHRGRTEELNPEVGGREWELLVVNDERVVNAMAAYGNVVVFTGILPVARNEEGLAAVLGHEIAHCVARHNSEKVSSSKVILAIATLLAAMGLDFGVSDWLSTLLLELPNSRTVELEADAIGLKLSAKACYDPRAVPEMFMRLGQMEAKQGGLGQLGFLRTHPLSKTRVEQLERKLHEAYDIQAANPACSGVSDQLALFQDAAGMRRGPSLEW